MQRSIAILLAIALSFPLIAPAFSGHSDTRLAPCCRKGGQHHCLLAQSGTSKNPSVQTVSLTGKCPYHLAGRIAVPHLADPFFAQQAATDTLSIQPAFDRAQAEAGYRISFFRSRQKRGPPSLLI